MYLYIISGVCIITIEELYLLVEQASALKKEALFSSEILVLPLQVCPTLRIPECIKLHKQFRHTGCPKYRFTKIRSKQILHYQELRAESNNG
jgi:hypothetical protein